MHAGHHVVAVHAERLFSRHASQKRQERVAEILRNERTCRFGAQQNAAVGEGVQEGLVIRRRSVHQAVEAVLSASRLAVAVVDDEAVVFGAFRVEQRGAGVVVKVVERARRLAVGHRDAHRHRGLHRMLLRAARAAQQLQNEPCNALDGVKAGNVFH